MVLLLAEKCINSKALLFLFFELFVPFVDNSIALSYYDAAKNVKGRKRHIMVDTLGLIMVVVVPLAFRIMTARNLF